MTPADLDKLYESHFNARMLMPDGIASRCHAAGLAAVFEAGQKAERAECAAAVERMRIAHAGIADEQAYQCARNAILFRNVQRAAPLAKAE